MPWTACFFECNDHSNRKFWAKAFRKHYDQVHRPLMRKQGTSGHFVGEMASTSSCQPRVIIQIKSFAELQFLLDDQFSADSTCKRCGTIENVDMVLSNTPHCLTIVLNWASGRQSQDTHSGVLAGITSPLEADSATINYIVASMICYADERYACCAGDEGNWLIYNSETIEICYADERYACFAGDEGNWMIYNSETIEICYADERYVCCARDEGHWLINDSETVETVDTWEHLLESFKDCKLQPEVLFFEVIK